MDKMFFVVFSFTFLCVTHIGSAGSNNFDNSEKELGDVCYLKNNQRGYCEEILKCDYAKELFRSKRTSEIVNCRFKGRVPLVCCPNLEIYKPTKFEQALCKTEMIQPRLQMDEKTEDFFYHVALGYKIKDEMMEIKCSGSLIADNIVLTAAVCVDLDSSVSMIASLRRTSHGLNDSLGNIPVQNIEIETIKIHPEYSKETKKNNIAIIKLRKPAIISEFVDTICLSSSDENLPIEFNMIDFEKPKSKNTKNSLWLVKGTMHQESIDNCKNMMRTKGNEVLDSQICTLSGSESDHGLKVAGNPMSYEANSLPFLYGITSYGMTNGSLNVVLYTKVNKFLSWIETEMMRME